MARDKKATDDKKPVSWKWRLFVWCFNLCLIVALGIVFYVAVIYFQMPSLDAILNDTRAPAIVFTLECKMNWCGKDFYYATVDSVYQRK